MRRAVLVDESVSESDLDFAGLRSAAGLDLSHPMRGDESVRESDLDFAGLRSAAGLDLSHPMRVPRRDAGPGAPRHAVSDPV